MKNKIAMKSLCSVIFLSFFFFGLLSISGLYADGSKDIKHTPLYEASLKDTLREFKEKEESIFEQGKNEAVIETPTRPDIGDHLILKSKSEKGEVAFGFPSYTTSYSCGATCGATCSATCFSTCTVTCGATCGSTCGTTCGPTCGSTCSATCVGNSTCIGSSTCAGSSTCFGTSTCVGTTTCVGSHTCAGSSTCVGTNTCIGTNTCTTGGSCNNIPNPNPNPNPNDPLPENPGADEPSAWAKEEVEAACELGLVPCHIIGKFKTDINREEFCEIAIELVKLALNKDHDMVHMLNGDIASPFDDVDNKAVGWAQKLEIVTGVGDKKFEPKRGISRQEAAKMLYNICVKVLKMDKEAPKSNFADAESIADWAIEPVDYVLHKKLMNGVGDNKFDPKGSYTREQAILTMYRLYKNSKGDEGKNE